MFLAMAREKNNTIHFFTPTIPSRPLATHMLARDEEEFDESDVIWNDDDDNNNIDDRDSYHTLGSDNNFTINNSSNNNNNTVHVSYHSSPCGYTAGISAALLAEEQPRSPTSIQRKTTSSPVSMISSSLLAKSNVSNINGPLMGSYLNGKRFHMSAPVNVPVWPNRLKHNGPQFGLTLDEDKDDEVVHDDGEMVPPHEIVARSHNTISFSVFEGAGRTLKGRDLTSVRNAVFQKTGFLD